MSEFTLTKEEVAEHNKEYDLYLIIDNKVYQCSKWAGQHPGGLEILAKYAGGDATHAFHTVHEHSESAKNKMFEFFIGDLVESKPQAPKSPQQTGASVDPKDQNYNTYIFLALFAIIFLAVVFDFI